MTAAEALRELRLLITDQLRRPADDIQWGVVHMMLWDVHWVLQDGCCPLTELRIRRYKRRVAMYQARASMPSV